MKDYLAPILPALLSALFSVFYTNRKTKSAGIRAMVDKLIERIDALAEKSIEFYATSPSTQSITLIQSQAATISRDISDLLKINDISALKERNISFRKAITGGDFASFSRPPYRSDNQVFGRISFTRDELISCLRLSCF